MQKLETSKNARSVKCSWQNSLMVSISSHLIQLAQLNLKRRKKLFRSYRAKIWQGIKLTIKRLQAQLLVKSLSIWMGDSLLTGKPSKYINNTEINSVFHPSGVGKSSTSLSG